MKANVYSSGSEQPTRVLEIDAGMIPKTAEQEDELFAAITGYLRGDGFEFTAIQLVRAQHQPASTSAGMN